MQIYIPKKLKIGYQKREGTYSNKLAYIIYYDEKGKLRKETSWESWRDKNIEPDEILNEPTSGFVLNKKAGGYRSHWNTRQTYCRVFDPICEGIEFEIQIDNLLYILENTNSIKGKGLEGEFVYGWCDKQLILIPCDSPDYQDITKYSNILNENLTIKAKDLILGATYKTKDNVEWTYLGKFDYYKSKYNYDTSEYEDFINVGKHFYFKREKGKYDSDFSDRVEIVKSITGKLISVIDENCHEDYAKWVKSLEKMSIFSPEDPEKNEWFDYTFSEFEKFVKGNSYWKYTTYTKNREVFQFYYDENKNQISYQTKTGPYNWNYTYVYKTIEEFYNEFQPKYKKIYLKNGNFCRKEY